MIENINEMIKLKFFKCRDVKTPSKSWEAAGWDFYIPENLSIFDFVNNYKIYLDDSIVFNKNLTCTVPLIFYLKSKRTVGEFKCRLYLQWNENTKNYMFKIGEYSDVNDWKMYNLNELNQQIIQWITEDDTTISKIEIERHGKVLIPSGIHVNLPEGIFLKAENKSGIASKRGLIFGASVIDYDYEGEIHINLINTTENNIIITAGEKIVQFVPFFQPYMKDTIEYDSLDELYKGKKSARGSGGFGSSGEK